MASRTDKKLCRISTINQLEHKAGRGSFYASPNGDDDDVRQIWMIARTFMRGNNPLPPTRRKLSKRLIALAPSSRLIWKQKRDGVMQNPLKQKNAGLSRRSVSWKARLAACRRRDEAGNYPRSMKRFANLACSALTFQRNMAGFDDQHMRKAAAVEMGRSSAGGVMASVSSRSIMLKPLTDLANDAIKQRALPELLSGRKGGALGITEPGGGSDVANMKTVARRDGNEWVLNGQKMFITGGMQASYFVIGARTGGDGMGGISLFFVDADAPGFSRTAIERKMGWWASDTATRFTEDCAFLPTI